MSMYGDYLRERLGHETIESENGFVTYRFLDEKTIYVVDIYVRPDFRKQSVATDLMNIVMKVAKHRGCTKLVGSVVPSAKGSTDSLKVLLTYGMTLESSGVDFILFNKEIS